MGIVKQTKADLNIYIPQEYDHLKIYFLITHMYEVISISNNYILNVVIKNKRKIY